MGICGGSRSKILEKITQIHPYADFVTDAGTAVLACLNTEEAYNNYGPVDVSLAAQNMMLAAHELGYGTCFCGVWPDQERVKEFGALCHLPDTVMVIGLIALANPLNKVRHRNALKRAKSILIVGKK